MQAKIAEAYSPTHGADVTVSEDAQSDFQLLGVVKAFSRGREIFAEGDAVDAVYKVVSGAVRSVRLLSDGRRQITDFYLPGDMFGVEFGSARRCGAEALCDAVVVVARRSGLMADSREGPRVWGRVVEELQRSQAHVLTLGRRSAAERVASFLIDLAERLGGKAEFELPMSRQDIADYLGLTIETVSRTLTQMQADGLVALRGCRRVRLADRQALQQLCE
jgi:CRP/FNR family nitrogen fixation transcriptional regulator